MAKIWQDSRLFNYNESVYLFANILGIMNIFKELKLYDFYSPIYAGGLKNMALMDSDLMVFLRCFIIRIWSVTSLKWVGHIIFNITGDPGPGSYDDYFGMNADTESIVYLMLANHMLHQNVSS
jgi:hypothetical protein